MSETKLLPTKLEQRFDKTLDEFTTEELREAIFEMESSLQSKQNQIYARARIMKSHEAIAMAHEIEDVKPLALLITMVNSWKTATCIGHYKGEQNDFRVEACKEEMERRGLPVPDNKFCSAYGDYNGLGAF